MTNKCCPSLKGLDFTLEEIKSCRVSNSRLRISIELTSHCNLHCIYCFKDNKICEQKTLSLSRIKEIIIEAKHEGVRTVVIPGDGEPTMDVDLTDIIDFNNNNGITTVLFTNGYRLMNDLRFVNYIYEHDVSLILKLNAANRQFHNMIVGSDFDHFAKTTKLIRELLRLGMGKEHRLSIHSVICKLNINSIERLWQFCRDNNIIPYFELIAPILTIAHLHQQLTINIDEIKNIFMKLRTLDNLNYGYQWNPYGAFPGGCCDKFYTNIYITNKGYVTPCIGIPSLILGDVTKKSIREIIESSTFKQLKNVRERLEGKCGECNNQMCYGCRAVAYAMSGGNLFAEYDLCAFRKEPKRSSSDAVQRDILESLCV